MELKFNSGDEAVLLPRGIGINYSKTIPDGRKQLEPILNSYPSIVLNRVIALYSRIRSAATPPPASSHGCSRVRPLATFSESLPSPASLVATRTTETTTSTDKIGVMVLRAGASLVAVGAGANADFRCYCIVVRSRSIQIVLQFGPSHKRSIGDLLY